MCNDRVITATFIRNNKEFTKKFVKPKVLENWCPKCNDNPEKKILFGKSICIQLFKENCDMVYELKKIKVTGAREYVQSLPNDFLELEQAMGDAFDFHLRLKCHMAEHLAKENVIYWNKIEIIAPFMTYSAKKSLKKKIACIKDNQAI